MIHFDNLNQIIFIFWNCSEMPFWWNFWFVIRSNMSTSYRTWLYNHLFNWTVLKVTIIWSSNFEQLIIKRFISRLVELSIVLSQDLLFIFLFCLQFSDNSLNSLILITIRYDSFDTIQKHSFQLLIFQSNKKRFIWCLRIKSFDFIFRYCSLVPLWWKIDWPIRKYFTVITWLRSQMRSAMNFTVNRRNKNILNLRGWKNCVRTS